MPDSWTQTPIVVGKAFGPPKISYALLSAMRGGLRGFAQLGIKLQQTCMGAWQLTAWSGVGAQGRT